MRTVLNAVIVAMVLTQSALPEAIRLPSPHWNDQEKLRLKGYILRELSITAFQDMRNIR